LVGTKLYYDGHMYSKKQTSTTESYTNVLKERIMVEQFKLHKDTICIVVVGIQIKSLVSCRNVFRLTAFI